MGTDGNEVAEVDIFVDAALDINDPNKRAKVLKAPITRSTDAIAEAIENNLACHYNQPEAFDDLNQDGVKIYQATIMRRGEEFEGDDSNSEEAVTAEALGSLLYSSEEVDRWIADLKTKGILLCK